MRGWEKVKGIVLVRRLRDFFENCFGGVIKLFIMKYQVKVVLFFEKRVNLNSFSQYVKINFIQVFYYV